jgi:hypothetical protein
VIRFSGEGQVSPADFIYAAFRLTSVLDKGGTGKVTVDETRTALATGDIWQLLADRYPDIFVTENFSGESRNILVQKWAAVAENVPEGKKLGIWNDGVCLLIAYCIEIVSHPDIYGVKAG